MGRHKRIAPAVALAAAAVCVLTVGAGPALATTVVCGQVITQDTKVSNDLTNESNRDEIVTMGVKGSEINIARNDGIAAWPTIVTFAESPKRAGVLYAGTDDGNLHVTRDGGKKWDNVVSKIPSLPKEIYVSEVVPSRFDEGTVYATFDGHRQNDFETYIYASSDYGQTWRSIVSNIKGEIARTLTEDVKNANVLYLGTETGLFVTLDRGRSWNRIKANLPTVRIDEIVLHPRDNAMILATHGRAIWILDSLSPIQEYSAAQSTNADARLFSPAPSIMYRRPARDRNYEFWGDQTFYGENPPQAAVISWLLKRQVGEVKLRITDAAGREVREISGAVLSNVNKAGIRSACWDLRVQPTAAPVPGGGGRGGEQGGRQGGEQGGRQGGGEQGGRQGGAGGQQAQTSPFGAGCGGGGGFGFGGFGGGGGGNPGPFVLPGVYTVELIVDGKTMDSKPLRVAADPDVVLTSAERKRMFDMAMEMHELHRRGTEIANLLTPVNRQMPELAKTVADRPNVPADVKAAFEALNKELSATMTRFAALAGGGGRGGGGGGAAGGRGGAPAPDNPLARLALAKNGLMATMAPTEQTTRAYNDAKSQVPKVLADATALVARARDVSASLAKYDITLTVPPATPKTTTSAEPR